MGRDVRHFTRRSRGTLLVALLLVALLGAGAAASYRFQVGPAYLPWLAHDTQPEPVPPPAGLDLPAPAPPTPLVDAAPTSGPVDPAAVRRALRGVLANDAFGPRLAISVAALEGPVWAQGPAAFTPASTTKVLTAVAALDVLGPEHRFTTSVTSGRRGGEIVLVGGGDPYLAASATPAQQLAAVYPERADLATLAVQVRAALAETGADIEPVRLRYDDTLFTGPSASEHWRADYVPDDVVAPITALMLDGGREDGGLGRADDPSEATAHAFAAALRDAGVKVQGRPRPGVAGSEQLASVQGARLADVVETVTVYSDNEGAELLAHHVGLAAGGEGSFAAGAAATLERLDGLGVDTSGTELYDGSGLSRSNLISTSTLIGTLRAGASAEHPDLRAAWTGLPVAGFTGSLYDRFADSERGMGLVRAKTGTLTGVHALAGTVLDAQGHVLLFVVGADRVDPTRALDAEAGLDAVATALTACSCTRAG